MIRLFFVYIFLFSLRSVSAQNININGKVTDENKAPLPYVNVFLEGTYTGTISNKDGLFNLSVPAGCQNKNLIVKSIGYRSDTIRINPSCAFYQVQLQSLSYPIGEVSVSQDDSLRRILIEAIRRIPANYLHVESRQTGFYRKYMKGKDEYLYFGEAVLDFFQPSYTTSLKATPKLFVKEAFGFGLTRKTGREKITPGSVFNMDEKSLSALRDLSLEKFAFKIALELGR